ncbi:hypothetical protein [Cupriavidus sp. IDO]|uniref:hypothetical protein n=1 Tax=Cupriavidus sp. IDO TaxID=1539142 RepID=UPI0005795E9F|nr:hypothetical protein [Cupriavidus sp. IDO]KWR88162.1 hypothetical protein RM96_21130 [Cupriavidus sp. IDO]
MIFESVDAYLTALRKEPAKLAVVSIMMAAQARKVSRAGIERMLKTGRLTEIQIAGTRCVLAKELIDLEQLEQDVVARVRKEIEKAAKLGVSHLFYQDIMTPVGLSTRVPADRDRIGKILGEISSNTYEESEILLSVLVHKKTAGRTRPSDGFFNLARSLDISFDDPDAFVAKQTSEVLKHYRRRK